MYKITDKYSMYRILSYIIWSSFILYTASLYCQRFFIPPIIKDQKTWDKVLFENNSQYFIEGHGGLHISIGSSGQAIYQRLGKPYFREYSNGEKIYYKLPTNKGFFLLKNGFIKLIHIDIPSDIKEDFIPFSAYGFHFSLITNKSIEGIKQSLLGLYKTPKYIDNSNQLIIYNYGVRYGFQNDQLSYIEIFFST